MLQDRLKWNKKYQTESIPNELSTILKQFFKLADGKKALDVAAGNGRNALFLADQGFAVDAVDISDAGLMQFAAKHPGIHIFVRGSPRMGFSFFKHFWIRQPWQRISPAAGIFCCGKMSFCTHFYH